MNVLEVIEKLTALHVRLGVVPVYLFVTPKGSTDGTGRLSTIEESIFEKEEGPVIVMESE